MAAASGHQLAASCGAEACHWQCQEEVAAAGGIPLVVDHQAAKNKAERREGWYNGAIIRWYQTSVANF
jgi:Na+-transporting NADH:ubiquinone oxidoreductase subunit NqrF